MATTPVFWPEKSHGQTYRVGYSLWGCKELDKTVLQTYQGLEARRLEWVKLKINFRCEEAGGWPLIMLAFSVK